MHQRLIQAEETYSFEIGNLASLEIMTEVQSNENGSGSGDEGSASGGGAVGAHNNSFEEKPARRNSLTSKSFCKYESYFIKINLLFFIY